MTERSPLAALLLLLSSCGRADLGHPPPAGAAARPTPALGAASTGQQAALQPASASDLSALREGDIVFQTSRSSQSQAIQAATRSPLSHMGLVLRDGASLAVYEAVGPVRFTPLGAWVARGEGHRLLAKRLKPPYGPLDDERLPRLRAAAMELRGRPYDLTFSWSDDRQYCSELVWKAYQRGLGLELAPLAKLRDFDLSHPAVAAKLRERYQGAVPLDEPVIAPAAIAGSPLLETVLER